MGPAEIDNIGLLLEAANSKLDQTERKIRNLLAAIDALEMRRQGISSELEYVQRADDRREMLSVFTGDGEYGSPSPVELRSESELGEEIDRLDGRIALHKMRIGTLRSLIEFVKRDIALLSTMRSADLARGLVEDADLLEG